MLYLFSDDGYARIRAMAGRDMLCLFDFDGTLAPIVESYDNAALPDDIGYLLRRLDERAPVGIVTGRSVADVRTRLGFEPRFLIGNHGLEGLPGSGSRRADYERLCKQWSDSLHEQLRDTRAWPGIVLEDKQYSLSVHYRQAPNPDEAEVRLSMLFAGLSPRPHVIGGKFVFNLLPQDAPNKGVAVAELMDTRRAPAALYVGDDVTDEDVFRLRRHDLLTVRIGTGTVSAAEFYLRDTKEIGQLLETLIDCIDR